MPIALVGKVYCKVDANYGAIRVCNLLTTFPTLGHATKSGDPLDAFGAVLGKVLEPLKIDQGLSSNSNRTSVITLPLIG